MKKQYTSLLITKELKERIKKKLIQAEYKEGKRMTYSKFIEYMLEKIN